jgi:hypothetical protein
MASVVQKIKLSPSRDIPFNKLVLSQSNVRRVKAGVSIEQLAERFALEILSGMLFALLWCMVQNYVSACARRDSKHSAKA